ncbi:MAG: hypothetical protein K2J62_11230 [Bacteroidales bacterium]|nr:hypothetical protein [Bacteroidales bacterium]
MKRIFVSIIFVFLLLPLLGQKYSPVSEYKKWDYISVKTICLPEYTLRDSSLIKLISEFMADEQKQEYYDKEGYVMLLKVDHSILRFMSIYPNMFYYSYYGSYDGVLYLDNHTFIVSFKKYDPYPFIPTGNRRYLEFLDYNQPKFGIKDGTYYYYTMPDPYEDDYPIWWVRYDKDHYELMEKPGVIYRFPSSEVLPKIDFDLNPKAESDVMINVL